MKQLLGVYSPGRPHWVGDGFPVRTLFSYRSHGKQLSPFLLLDYAGPETFPPATSPRGVGAHPHRGFETVTVVYQGEVAHRDTTGHGGTIGPGDVQWMTAGSGVLHEEFHGERFSREGGELEMIQLWVNLPAASKMVEPAYQAIAAAAIPVVPLPGQAGSLRVIAGEHAGVKGPANTFSPLHLWDVALNPASRVELELPDGWNGALVVRQGEVSVNGEASAGHGQMVVIGGEGRGLAISSAAGGQLLLLSGKPLDEPIVGEGPFVMSDKEQLAQAFADFEAGHFGRMA
ncbi:pirin family protein [Chromobacterium phragmitis]|uniref:Pirin family protein n=1 Tax=Chromobacterium phragmitis TaxID=2202141 RepID=A0A344UIH7_9NEIS|nr:pirin family protein [Chromobacterium phragmitis]AXE35075.1 quercetin 2,3-dioxygenase [Chromobacterium phragmitis]